MTSEKCDDCDELKELENNYSVRKNTMQNRQRQLVSQRKSSQEKM
jgi:hypothetical protein